MTFPPHIAKIPGTKIVDITGQKFGRLTVVNFISIFNSKTKWACKCDCGKSTVADGSHLKQGATRSCGCLQDEQLAAARTKHGLSRTPEYKAYNAMISRCLNKDDAAYSNYGGRGIEVCFRWIQSFENFLTDMGVRPSNKHSLDRIKNELGYSPENCRWATKQEQDNNKRINVFIEWGGQRKTIAEWERHYGVYPDYIRNRLNRNQTMDFIIANLPKK